MIKNLILASGLIILKSDVSFIGKTISFDNQILLMKEETQWKTVGLTVSMD